MEPAVLAGPPAAVLRQETLSDKAVGEGAARISSSHSGQTDPLVWSLESPSRMIGKCRNREGNSEQSNLSSHGRLWPLRYLVQGSNHG